MIDRMKLLATGLLALTLSLGACAPGASVQGPAADGEVAKVQVSNNNWADMTVYAVRNGMRSRLGTVTSMTTQTFEVPRGMTGSSGELQLVADPVGSRSAYTTRPVAVWPGQTVDFTIENHLAISSVAVW